MVCFVNIVIIDPDASADASHQVFSSSLGPPKVKLRELACTGKSTGKSDLAKRTTRHRLKILQCVALFSLNGSKSAHKAAVGNLTCDL
jgi:hypothetical protein